MRTIEADYLVVGAGAMGLAFTDTLVAESDATVVVVDRNDQPGRPLDDGLSVRAASSAVGLLRRELSEPRQRHHRPRRPQRRLLRVGQRRRGLRVLRRGDASASPADGPRDVPADERIPRRRAGAHARRRGHRGERAARRHHPRRDRRAVDAGPVLRRRRRRRLRPAQRPAAHPRGPRQLRDRRRGQDRDGRMPVAAAPRRRAATVDVDQTPRLVDAGPRGHPARPAVRQARAARLLRPAGRGATRPSRCPICSTGSRPRAVCMRIDRSDRPDDVPVRDPVAGRTRGAAAHRRCRTDGPRPVDRAGPDHARRRHRRHRRLGALHRLQRRRFRAHRTDDGLHR